MNQKTINIFLSILLSYTALSQKTYSDIYFTDLKGKIKTVSSSSIFLDSSRIFGNAIEKQVLHYNKNGNFTLEENYLDSLLIGKFKVLFENNLGFEKRYKKLRLNGEDSIFSTSTYFYDETGFDTLIQVLHNDSSYFMLHKYEKNEVGLRIKGTEINGHNQHQNNTFEIDYDKFNQVSEVRYYDRFGKLDLSEKYYYNKKGELIKLEFSDGFIYEYEVQKRDKKGNWTESITYRTKGKEKTMITKQYREIEYY